MHIVVFGANGATGRILTQQALDDGHIVTAMTRHPEQFPLHHSSLRVVPGDVFDLAAVERAVAGQDAVLSTLGVPFTRKPIAVYSRGIANIIAAMKRYGVRRLVCVSSSVTDGAHDTGGGFIFDKTSLSGAANASVSALAWSRVCRTVRFVAPRSRNIFRQLQSGP